MKTKTNKQKTGSLVQTICSRQCYGQETCEYLFLYQHTFTAPFLSSVHLHGTTLSFLSDRNPLWTHSSVTSNVSFPKTIDLPCFLFLAVHHPSLVSAARFMLCKLSFA